MGAKHYQIPHLEEDVLVHNLKQLMHNAHINEAELARQTNIPQPTLHKILAGNTIDPRISTLKLLADYFNISLDELYLSPQDFNHQVKTKTQTIPIISWSDCIKSLSYISSLSQTNWDKWLVTEPLTKHAYSLLSKPSMEPHFPKNTILIISPDITPSDGDFVVVHYERTEEATLRELIIDGPNKLLVPLSSNINQDPLNEHIKILGVLLQSRFAYHGR